MITGFSFWMDFFNFKFLNFFFQNLSRQSDSFHGSGNVFCIIFLQGARVCLKKKAKVRKKVKTNSQVNKNMISCLLMIRCKNDTAVFTLELGSIFRAAIRKPSFFYRNLSQFFSKSLVLLWCPLYSNHLLDLLCKTINWF